jgi:hypothetical protein
MVWTTDVQIPIGVVIFLFMTKSKAAQKPTSLLSVGTEALITHLHHNSILENTVYVKALINISFLLFEDIDGACSTHGSHENCIKYFC